MTERTALGAAIEKHWRTHRPQMVKELEKTRQLKAAVLQAEELTGDLLYELVSVNGMPYGAAWELAMREALLTESSQQKPETGKPTKRYARKPKTRTSGKSSPAQGRARATKSSRSRKRGRRGTSG